jgi:hypothetical protein|tara:strand:+ start:225 stop:473 length:249 start_codon:yes stop_codon:yes gene_type:complete
MDFDSPDVSYTPVMKLTNEQITELLKREIPDDVLLEFKRERNGLVRERDQHRRMGDFYAKRIKAFDKLIRKHKERLKNLLTK